MMIEVDGFKLEPLAKPDYPGSEHYWPCVRVIKIGCLDAVHFFALRSLERFDSRDPSSVLAAAIHAIACIRSVSVGEALRARIITHN